jgi:NodT family efflux transporter outer membrane factor (OMF) lipoprotein
MRPRLQTLLGAALLLGAAAAPAQAPAGGADRSPTAFWSSVRDTTLERLMRQALDANRDVRAAAARVRGARAERTAATFDLAPTVTAAAGYTRQRLAGPTFPGSRGALPEQDLWDAGLRLSYEVDVFGRVRRGVRARTALADAASEDLRDVRVLLTAEVADAYFALRGAQDRLAVARRNAENQRGTLDLTVQRLEGGRGTELDTERARAQLATTLAEVPTLEAAVEAAQYRLGVLTARDASTLAVGDSAAEIALPAEVLAGRSDSLVHAVVTRRPDVRSAEQQVAARSAFVGAAKADYLPRLSIGAASGYTSSALGTLGNAGTPRFAVGPVVSWPALDLGRVRAGVDAARADEEEARATYEGAVLRATGEVETALTAYRKSRERLAQLDAAATASAKAAELARLRFTEGASDFLQVLDAERTLLDAQDRRAAGHAEATARLVAVYRALGGA